MPTLDHRPPETPAPRDTWFDALKLYGINRTPGWYRQRAEAGLPVDAEAAFATAGLEAGGLTPRQAYYLAGLDRKFGPYMSRDGAVFTAAALLSSGHDPASLPDDTHPAIVDMAFELAELGVTRADATLIMETGLAPALVTASVPSPRAVPGSTPEAA